jgi:hypothetical protein
LTTRFVWVAPGIFVGVVPVPPSVCHWKERGVKPAEVAVRVTLSPAAAAVAAEDGVSMGGAGIGAVGRDKPMSKVASTVF